MAGAQATGANYTMDAIMQTVERIINAERLFITRARFSSKDDILPPRIISEKVSEGPAKGKVCHLNKMLPEYYRLRGWDENGMQKKKSLKNLA